MKIFLIKTIIVFISILLLFKLTIGSVINKIQKEVDSQISEEKIILIKEKVKREMKKGIEKDRILNVEDAELIGKFIQKILTEINQGRLN